MLPQKIPCGTLATMHYIDRRTKKEEKEKVYGKFFIELLYSQTLLSKIAALLLLPLVSKIPFTSHLYGRIQKSHWSRKKVKPFIEKFKVDTTEFLDPVSSYQSFNDFFIRKLKPSARPIAPGHDIAVLPADGRYLVFPSIHLSDGFVIKDKKFHLEKLLNSTTLAHKYAHGSMVIARLCPTDYHRFHFPASGIPTSPKLINGHLYSVNPLALQNNIHYLTENKRYITELHTKKFGTIQYIEVGATYVGTVHQTYIANEPYAKGDEKGYFSFGGSCIILLFEPGRIQFDQDLLEASHQKIETLALMGQSLGRALEP